MSVPVLLSEYEDRRVDLAPADAAFVATRLGGRIVVSRDLGGGYVLNPRQYVGLATLPSGVRLECRPKVPARNLFVLLAAAYDLPDPFLDAPAEVDRIEDVLAFVVGRFAALVEERLDRGLYRAYVEEEGNLATVRGRIAVAEDLRRNYILRQRTWCRYSEYAWDVPENQVLRQVVRLLAGWGLRPELGRRLRRLDARLEEVTPGRFVAADLDRFAYHRLNEAYRPLHRFCRLFLEGASPSGEAGPFGFAAFLLDMNRLFEAYVTQILRDHAPTGLAVAAQAVVHLDRDRSVAMHPDVLVRASGQVVLAADCKYKHLAPGRHGPHDLYQLLAYCTALGVERGVLVYPLHLAPLDGTVRVCNTGVTIREISLDLGGTRAELEAAGAALARSAFGLAVGAGDPPGTVPL